MTGSPAYLRLLDGLRQDDPTHFAWDALEQVWSNLVDSQFQPRELNLNLLILADVSLSLAAQTAGRTFNDEVDHARDLHLRKNAGYAGVDNSDPWANFRLSQAFEISPLRGVLVRMSDKLIRIRNLRANPNNEQVGESLVDTLRDLAAYALIALCLLDEETVAA